MVHIGILLVAPVEDTAFIGVPGGGVHVDSQGADGGERVHHAVVVVVGQLHVAVDGGHGQGGLGGGKGAGVVRAWETECVNKKMCS